jgi:branched-subunit amino acid transport protein
MSAPTNLWLILIVGGLITFGIRLSFIVFFGRQPMPDWLRRGLRFVPPAVLSAIIFPEILIRDGKVALSLSNPRLLAGVLAALVAWRTRSMLLTILAGMVTLWVLQLLIH